MQMSKEKIRYILLFFFDESKDTAQIINGVYVSPYCNIQLRAILVSSIPVQRSCSRLFSSVHSIPVCLVCVVNKRLSLHPTGRELLVASTSDSKSTRASEGRWDLYLNVVMLLGFGSIGCGYYLPDKRLLQVFRRCMSRAVTHCPVGIGPWANTEDERRKQALSSQRFNAL
ncbi:hypothetical protein TNCV_2109171 [Trichonephila clavipes]|nr:hypothetical protein TNCV_2109171 [Trichonephila clavipes]